MSKVVTSTKGDILSITNKPIYAEYLVSRESSRNWRAACSNSTGTKLAAAVNGGFIYTSTDTGGIWTQRASSKNWLAIACSSDGVKLVASADFIYTSADSGVNWTQRITAGGNAVAASSSDGSKLLVTGFDNFLYTSTDSGVNWTQRSPQSSWQDAASSSDGSILVVVDDQAQMYISTDSGANWTVVAIALTMVTVDISSDASVIFIGAYSGAYISTDMGTTVEVVLPTPGEYVERIRCSSDGKIVVAATQAGYIYTSQNRGVSWAKRISATGSWRAMGVSDDGAVLIVGGTSTTLYRLTPIKYTPGLIELGPGSNKFVSASDIVGLGLVYIPSVVFKSSTSVTSLVGASLYIDGSPMGSVSPIGNITTLTRSYALYVNSGSSYIDSLDAKYLNMATANTGTSSTAPDAINLNDNPLLIRGSSKSDTNHYIMYANITGNTFAGQAVDGPAVVGFAGGILGSSNGNTWAMKWAANSSTTFNGTSSLTASGSTTNSAATLYSNPASTALSGSNNYFFNVFNTPTTTGSTSGTAATITVLGAPSNATTSYALNVVAGATNHGGTALFAGAGSTASSTATLYSNPASTAFSGSNNYFFNTFNTPTTTGSTSGTAATVSILGAPSGATTSYALNVAGTTNLTGTLSLNKAGNTTNSSAPLYSNPASTALSSNNNYFFNYFATPATTGSTSGTAATVTINGPPAGATNSYALHVVGGIIKAEGSANVNFASYGFINSAGGTGTSSGTNSYGIVVTNRVAGNEFNSTSSRKLKNIKGLASDDAQEVVNAFRAIDLYKYQYKDINDGDEEIYGIVAEELLKNPITAKYVKSHRRYVPNIYQPAIVFDEQTIILDKKITEVEEVAKILIYSRDERVEISDFELVDGKILHISGRSFVAGEMVFVYGTEEECPTVTKNHVFEMNLVVTQYILRKLEGL